MSPQLLSIYTKFVKISWRVSMAFRLQRTAFDRFIISLLRILIYKHLARSKSSKVVWIQPLTRNYSFCWLCVLIMSHTRFRVNILSVVACMSTHCSKQAQYPRFKWIHNHLVSNKHSKLAKLALNIFLSLF